LDSKAAPAVAPSFASSLLGAVLKQMQQHPALLALRFPLPLSPSAAAAAAASTLSPAEQEQGPLPFLSSLWMGAFAACPNWQLDVKPDGKDGKDSKDSKAAPVSVDAMRLSVFCEGVAQLTAAVLQLPAAAASSAAVLSSPSRSLAQTLTAAATSRSAADCCADVAHTLDCVEALVSGSPVYLPVLAAPAATASRQQQQQARQLRSAVSSELGWYWWTQLASGLSRAIAEPSASRPAETVLATILGGGAAAAAAAGDAKTDGAGDDDSSDPRSSTRKRRRERLKEEEEKEAAARPSQQGAQPMQLADDGQDGDEHPLRRAPSGQTAALLTRALLLPEQWERTLIAASLRAEHSSSLSPAALSALPAPPAAVPALRPPLAVSLLAHQWTAWDELFAAYCALYQDK
jgi:hypothetical protein